MWTLGWPNQECSSALVGSNPGRSESRVGIFFSVWKRFLVALINFFCSLKVLCLAIIFHRCKNEAGEWGSIVPRKFRPEKIYSSPSSSWPRGCINVVNAVNVVNVVNRSLMKPIYCWKIVAWKTFKRSSLSPVYADFFFSGTVEAVGPGDFGNDF